MPSDEQSRLMRAGAAAAAVTLLCIFLGCMSLSIGGRTEVIHHVDNEEDLLIQEGEAKVPGDSELDVYYPKPYPNVPNLVLTSHNLISGVQLLVQKEDHFRVRNPDLLPMTVNWTAKGARQPAQILTVPGSPPPVPPPELLPKPLPPAIPKGDG
jgi:hypothetical protein